ncbi:MAG: sulfatase-like hydrolase/transferase [Oxalobacter sp.]|nr:sulfatase-like hydrolase/transferase [Oxalobacter sp.]
MRRIRFRSNPDNPKGFFFYYVCNAVIVALLGTLILSRNLSVYGTAEWGISDFLYFGLYGISWYGFWLVLATLPAYFLHRFNFRKTGLALQYIFCASFLIFITADTFVYNLFRLHPNLAMIQMTFFGGGQIVQFTAGMIIQITLLTVAVLIATGLCMFIAKFINRKWYHPKTAFYALLGLFLTCQIIYGFAYAFHRQALTAVAEVMPLNKPLTFNRLLIKWKIVDADTVNANNLNLQNSKKRMNYPLHPLDCSDQVPQYNIVFLFVDSLRADMLKQEVMPNAWAFSQENIRFHDHLSGGINTRHGIFTLFTGLPGSYWQKALATKTPSILVQALQQRQYAINAFTGAGLTMPEFNRTVFIGVENLRINPRGSRVYQRDDNAVEDFMLWHSKLPSDKPFFSFIFFDNVHAYDFPEDAQHTLFKPYWEEVNNLQLNNDFDPHPYLNRYKNAVHYADINIGKVLAYLKQKNLLDKTIVVLSSDHGEEFNDSHQNYWGHNGNFMEYQTKVPLVIHWPGKGKGGINYRTSGLDMAPTLLPQALGCKNPTTDYAVGTSLFTQENRRNWVYVSNYSQDAFVEPNRIILINQTGAMQYLDTHYQPAADTTPPPFMSTILEESSRYLRK